MAKPDFSKPNPAVKPIDAVFGPRCIADLIPAMEDIPKDFLTSAAGKKWAKFQSDWFFDGLENLTTTPKPGIDETEALRHLSAIQRSFEPKHEHKQAAVAYLASLWFEDVKYETAKEKKA